VIVVAPVLAGAVGAGDHEPMQDGEEDGTLNGKLEAAISKQFLQHLATAGVAPKALEQQRQADALAGEGCNTASLARSVALVDEGPIMAQTQH
jgi:hypothetical protein